MIRTLEEREKNREQQRTYQVSNLDSFLSLSCYSLVPALDLWLSDPPLLQEHLSSLKQDNEHLSMTLAMNQKEDSKKKGFLTTLFNKNKTNKNKVRNTNIY